ncbi:hypothetical protein [Deinococcus altitudinis]|uniref:hypothetical protein n=1 Tax=Deinococcus altitudinis TaxID=468914 RepID=UPI0038921C7D
MSTLLGRRPRRHRALAVTAVSLLLGGAVWVWQASSRSSQPSDLGSCPRVGQVPMPIACVPKLPAAR